MRNDYYVYAHYLNENDTTPFYVGRGCRNRAYSKSGRNKQWHKVVADNNGFVVKFIKDDLLEEDALSLEIELIKKYGRRNINTGVLVNETFGGETATRQFVITPEMEERIKIVTAKLAQEHKRFRFI